VFSIIALVGAEAVAERPSGSTIVFEGTAREAGINEPGLAGFEGCSIAENKAEGLIVGEVIATSATVREVGATENMADRVCELEA
jgi:hypothetical protein